MALITHSAPQKRKYPFNWKDYEQIIINRGDISFYLDILDDMIWNKNSKLLIQKK